MCPANIEIKNVWPKEELNDIKLPAVNQVLFSLMKFKKFIFYFAIHLKLDFLSSTMPKPLQMLRFSQKYSTRKVTCNKFFLKSLG